MIAHIKVPPTYFEAQEQSPASGTPHALSRTPSDTDAAAAAARAGAVGSGGPLTPRFVGVSPHEIASMLLPGVGAAAAAVGASPAGTPPRPQQQQQQSQSTPPQQQLPWSQQQPLSSADAAVIHQASDSLAVALTTPRSTHSTPPFR